MTSASFQNATSIGKDALAGRELSDVFVPNATIIGDAAFAVTKLTSVNFQKVTSIGTMAFYGCKLLTSAIFPNTLNIDERAFSGC